MGVSRPKPSRPSANFRVLGRDSWTVWDGLGRIETVWDKCPKLSQTNVPNRPKLSHTTPTKINYLSCNGLGQFGTYTLNVWEQAGSFY